MTIWTVQKQTQRTTQKRVKHQDATDIPKKILFSFVCFVFCKIKTKLYFTRKLQFIVFMQNHI